ncbi:MAG: ferredoxin [Desulfobulbus sp.]|jgi:ferredoxin|nr:ferredoxin [Desulfobulbus sp.]
MKTVQIDEEECIGCGTCAELCPEIFAMNDDTDKAYVIMAEGGNEACIDDASASCPVSCITNE